MVSGSEAPRARQEIAGEVKETRAEPNSGIGGGPTVGNSTEVRAATNEMAEPNAPAAPQRAAAAEPLTPFRITDRARWSDVDAAGIVCYGAYLRFCELAETELFRASGLTVAHIQQHFGLWLVRRRVEFDFHRSILLDEEVEIFAHVVTIGRTSLELAFLVRRLGEQEPAVEARYVLVAVDHQALRPVPVPDEVRAAIQPWEISREAAGAGS